MLLDYHTKLGPMARHRTRLGVLSGSCDFLSKDDIFSIAMTPWALHRNSHSPRSAGLRFPPTYTLLIPSCLASFICRIASSIISTSSVIINILDTWVPCASVGDISVAHPASLTSAGNHLEITSSQAGNLPPPHLNVPSILAPFAHFIPSRNIYSSRQSSYIWYYLSIRSRCVFRLSRNFLCILSFTASAGVSPDQCSHHTDFH